MKRLLLLLTLSFSLTGCFGNNSEKTAAAKVPEGFRLYETEEFRIHIPSEWEVLTAVDFKSTENILTAFRSNIRSEKFTPNVAIIKNELSAEASADTSSLDYAKSLFRKVKDEITGFKEIAAENIKISVDGKETETLFTYFEGKDKADSDLKGFMQIAAVAGKNAMIASAAFLASENEGVVKKVETIVKSFKK